MNEQQYFQISSLHKIIVDDNGYAFLTFHRHGNILKADNEDYSLDLDSLKTKTRTQWNIFGVICDQIIKDTYVAHKFDYDNAAEHNRKICFSYCISENQASMECEINIKKALKLLGLMKV